ncbi:uncharacterized protein [Penaeus vannamei]|uniref:uncharacterized protein n=1 Tax=Penaeus vannamei TaxID=6689 RepID=UPI00387F7969
MVDFNAVSGCDRTGYEMFVGPHGSGADTSSENSLLFRDFARSQKRRISGSWYQCPDPHRWTWVYRSAEFCGTDHRLVVDTLWVHFSGPMITLGCFIWTESESNNLFSQIQYINKNTTYFNGGMAEPSRSETPLGRALELLITENKKEKSGHIHDNLTDLVLLWDTCKREMLDAAQETFDECFAGNTGRHRCLPCGLSDRGLGLALFSGDSSSLSKWLDRLRSCCGVGVLAEYFEQLYQVDSPKVNLYAGSAVIPLPDPPISEDPPSLTEVRGAISKLKSGKALGICNTPAELLKAHGEPMACGLHAVQAAIWWSVTVPPDFLRGVVIPLWKGKGDRWDCSSHQSITLLSIPGKVLAHILLRRIREHLLRHQRQEQSGFTLGKSTVDRIFAFRVIVERRHEFRHRPQETVRYGASGITVRDPETERNSNKDYWTNSVKWLLGRATVQSLCGATQGNIKVTDHDFADDVAILSESLETLVVALEAFSYEAKPLGLEVS